MLLLYILWDGWLIPIISGSTEQLQQQLEYTPTKLWLSQLVNFKNATWTLEERYAIKFCFKLGKNTLRWKLDLLLWPRDRETEFSVEACWLSQTREGQTEQIHPQTFDDPFFWQHWHDLHAVGSNWTDNQQGILCWGFERVQEEIRSEEACTLQIGSVAFPPGYCTSLQLHRCHRLFDQDRHQDSSSPSLKSRPCSLWLLVNPKAQRVSLWVNWGDERGCYEGHWHAHTRRLPWGLPEVVGTIQQVNCSRRR